MHAVEVFHTSEGDYPYLTDKPLMVVTTDLALRQSIVADKLDVPLSDELLKWQAAQEKTIVAMLEEPYDGNVVYMNASEVRRQLETEVELFRQQAEEERKSSFVISLDPTFLDPSLADYTFQETRVSVVTPNSPIDLENQPQRRTNRFVYASEINNGAGKSREVQLMEIQKMMQTMRPPIALALVEDYVDTGRGILDSFGFFIDNPSIDVTVLTGLVNPVKAKALGEKVTITAVANTPESVRTRHADVSDLVPTLGGKVIGVSQATSDGSEVVVPRTVESMGYRIPVSVDLGYGDYQRQTKALSPMASSAFVQELSLFSLDTAQVFWSSLERTLKPGEELLWKDLKPLVGTARTYYPAVNGARVPEWIQPGPRRAVKAIANTIVHS